MLAKFIQSYLTFERAKVRVASNREEVVAEFADKPAPDLIVLDVVLPNAEARHPAALAGVPSRTCR